VVLHRISNLTITGVVSKPNQAKDIPRSVLHFVTLQTEQNIAFSGQMEQSLGRTAKSVIILNPNFA
jgi:hypothetical protein